MFGKYGRGVAACMYFYIFCKVDPQISDQFRSAWNNDKIRVSNNRFRFFCITIGSANSEDIHTTNRLR